MVRRHLRAVDLFCGAGGLSLGLQRAGFEIVGAFDNFDAAVETYRANLGDHIVKLRLDENATLPAVDLIAGGPPCQGFSSAGQRRPGDKRNTLVAVFAQLIAKHRPSCFIFENVEGFLTGENGDRVLDLLMPLVAAGYRIRLRKVNVANYGVPQLRKRVIAIGGLGWDPLLPEPTHAAHGAPGADLVGKHLPPTPSVAEALRGLPPPADDAPGDPQGHWAPALAAEELVRVRALKPGQTMRDLPEELWHPSYKRRAFRRVMDGTPTEHRGGAPAGKRRLRSDEPSKAITGGARGEFLHPVEDRFLTLRECARIQSFPDDFEFKGAISDQAILIGNAVPPAFAAALARAAAEGLSTAQETLRDGALLSFEPTLSAGMSPALQSLCERVRGAFGSGVSALQRSFVWD